MKIKNLFKRIPELYRNFSQPEKKIGTLLFSFTTWLYCSSFRPKLTFSMFSFSLSTIDLSFELTKHLALIYLPLSPLVTISLFSMSVSPISVF